MHNNNVRNRAHSTGNFLQQTSHFYLYFLCINFNGLGKILCTNVDILFGYILERVRCTYNHTKIVQYWPFQGLPNFNSEKPQYSKP